MLDVYIAVGFRLIRALSAAELKHGAGARTPLAIRMSDAIVCRPHWAMPWVWSLGDERGPEKRRKRANFDQPANPRSRNNGSDGATFAVWTTTRTNDFPLFVGK